MPLTNFISSVWSETLLSQMDKKYIAVANCNREFEGEIKNRGDRVKICGIGDINIFDYTKNADFETSAQELTDGVKTMKIDQAKAFNFQIDDIDRAQSSPKLMGEAMRVAAAALANTADAYVFGLYADAGKSIKNDAVTADNVMDMLISARTALYGSGVGDSSDVVLEVSPEIAALILKAKITLSTDNGEALETGCLGSVGGCKVYVSPNIVKETGDGVTYHKCLARTTRAIAFAEQLSEIDAYRPEKRFADAVKGLHLYGAKVVHPAEMILLDLGIAA